MNKLKNDPGSGGAGPGPGVRTDFDSSLPQKIRLSQPGGNLAELGAILELDIRCLLKEQEGGCAKYSFCVMEGGREIKIPIGGIGELMSQKAMRMAIFEGAGRVLPHMSSDDWDALLGDTIGQLIIWGKLNDK